MEDPKDEALPGSPVPGALQVPSLEVSTTETSYTAASPSPEGLHSLSLPAFWSPQPSGSLSHTPRRCIKKTVEPATKEAGRSLPSPRGSPRQAPARSRALADARQRPPRLAAAPGRAPAGRRWSLSDDAAAGAAGNARSPADLILQRVCWPPLFQTLLSLRKGPRPPSLDPHRPHTGAWGAGTCLSIP